MAVMVRTHVTLRKELLDAADRIVGERKRSELIGGLLEEWVLSRNHQDALMAFLAEAERLGVADPNEAPTAEEIARSSHDDRRAGSARTAFVDAWIEEQHRAKEGAR